MSTTADDGHLQSQGTTYHRRVKSLLYWINVKPEEE